MRRAGPGGAVRERPKTTAACACSRAAVRASGVFATGTGTAAVDPCGCEALLELSPLDTRVAVETRGGAGEWLGVGDIMASIHA